MLIEINHDQISSMVFHELQMTLDQFREDMEIDNPQVFSLNEVADKLQIQKHIEALELILDWYREPFGG
jgi:hypothetical protein